MKEEILKQLGSCIRDLRKERGLSQEQLSEIAGFHYTYLGAIERAEKNISILNLEKIANALQVNVHDLFAYERHNNQVNGKSKDIDQLLKLLLRLNSNEVRKARNILIEMFDE